MGGIDNKTAILAITVILAYAVAVESNSNCKNAACPPYNGSSIIVSNPNECESYCVCTCDDAIYMPCPAGLHYNKECHMCDWPSHAGCEPITPSTPEPVTTPRPSTGCDMVKPFCPTLDEGNTTLLPNPNDCGSYCLCDWGNPIWFPCPNGLHFNPALKKCEPPELAGCDPSYTPDPSTTDFSTTEDLCNSTPFPITPSTPSSIIPDSSTPDISTSGTSTPSTSTAGTIAPDSSTPAETTQKPKPTGTTGSCDKVKPLCPSTNEGYATLLPNPDDCGSYCVCDWGKPIWMPCPPGLHFNPTLKVCDYPEHAGCETPPPPPQSTPAGGSTPGGGSTSGGSTSGGGTTAGGGQPDGSTTHRPPGPTGSCDKVKPLCPPTNEGDATLLPNPDDCGSYCVCDWGKPIWMPCPPGLHFNPTLKVCDYPEHAGCENPPPPPESTPAGGSTPGGGTTSGGGTPGGSTTVRPPRPTGSCEKVKPLCPPINEVNATLLPNPDDCGSYCVCDWGVPIWMPCPAGLHFNPVLKVCDYPEHAGCISPPPTSAKPTSSPAPVTTSLGTTTSDPPTTKSSSTSVPTTEAITTTAAPATTTAAPATTTTAAPATTTTAAPVTTTTAAPATTTTAAATTTSKNPTTEAPSTSHGIDGCHIVQPKCPVPENPDHATLFANPWDTHSYCKCDWGKVHWMPCSPGIAVFYEDLQACV